jgi:BASS family bile acid:Na+ symporter
VDIVKGLALVMIVSTMFGAGLQVNVQRLREALRDVAGLLKALLVNVVLVPAFAFALVTAFHVDEDVAIGILLMAMAPGVPFLVNAAGRKQGGSHAIAIRSTIIFSAITVITLPLTAPLLLPTDVAVKLPVQQIVVPLILFQLLPIVAGMLLAPRLKPELIERLVRVLHLAFIAAALVVVVLIFPKVASSVADVYGFGHLAIIAAIGIFSLVAGWLIGGTREYRRTLSIATLLRNVGTCAMLATTNFPDTLVAAAVMAYFVVTFVLSIFVRVYYQRTASDAAPATA